MYYISNVGHLGDKICISYSNMYINFLILGCVYKDQDKINKLCPKFVKNIKSVIVPDLFMFCLK